LLVKADIRDSSGNRARVHDMRHSSGNGIISPAAGESV
jgi:hypothetical protein